MIMNTFEEQSEKRRNGYEGTNFIIGRMDSLAIEDISLNPLFGVFYYSLIIFSVHSSFNIEFTSDRKHLEDITF